MDNNFFNNNDYNDINNTPHERKGLATASVLVGITSIVTGYCTGIFGIIFGLVAILMGFFSKGALVQRSGKAIAGIITGAVGIVLGIIMLVLAVVLMTTNPDFLQQYQELLEFYNRT